VRADASFFPSGKVIGTLSQSLAFVYYRKLKIREAIPHYSIDLHGVVLNQTQGPKDTGKRTCSTMSSTKESRSEDTGKRKCSAMSSTKESRSKDTGRRTCSVMSSTKESRFKSPETQPTALR
jgi:hypothetical protein